MKAFFLRKKKYLLPLLLVLAMAFAASVFALRDYIFLSEDGRFEKFTERIFSDEITSNTINLHYTLAYPQEYGIDDYEVSLGTMEPEVLKKSSTSAKKLLKKLERFDSSKLSRSNQITYDILSLELENQASLDQDSYLLYEPLGPNLGIQAQLPVLLAEYDFRTSVDIKDYFNLLACIPEYFQEILEFESEKSAEGLFMSDTSAERIIQQCRAFTATGEENYLYSMFNQRTEALLEAKRIDARQAETFMEMHEKLMQQYVFPAYEALALGLERLAGTGTNEKGLAGLTGGKDYYEYLVKSSVGDYRDVETILQTLFEQLTRDYDSMGKLLHEEPELLSKAAALPVSSDISPEQMLDYLRRIITDDFPALETEDYEVKYVPSSMEEFSSPAFYLTPPIDTQSPNIIYINQSSQVSQAELFTTLAHEGFPGHLYQTLYFSGQKTDPIRELLGNSGYIEGWATYVESLSYEYGAQFLNIEPKIMEFLCLNRSISLCLYSILDIGIHYQGWNLDIVTDSLAVFGITDQETCREIFQYIIENPANYLKYYLGYLNFCSLRGQVEELEGSSFHLKDFHEKLLKLGPAPFPVVEKYLLMEY